MAPPKPIKDFIRTVQARTGLFFEGMRPNRGVNLFFDLKRDFPAVQLHLAMDVGANVGDTAIEIVRYAPGCRVICFEPTSKAFAALEQNTRHLINVDRRQFGLGAEEGAFHMDVSGPSDLSRLAPAAAESGDTNSERVSIRRLDDLCREESIDHVDFLKIDTEGADLDVVKGAGAMLARQAIDIIQVESGMNHDNGLHVYFEDFQTFFPKSGYRLYALYEQTMEWPVRRQHLRRANLVYVSDKVLDKR